MPTNKGQKSPKRPLIFYYAVTLIVLMLLNWLFFPSLLSRQVTEVGYDELVSMVDDGKVETVSYDSQDHEIVFEAKDDKGKGEDEDKLKRIRARFNKIATASDLPELNHHLRGVINLLSGNGIKLDYADLAVDLYNYSYAEGRTKVRLKWGQDFCRQIKNDEN